MKLEKVIKEYLRASKNANCEIVSIYVSGSYANDYYIEGVSDYDLLIILQNINNVMLNNSDEIIQKTNDVELDVCLLSIKEIFESPNSQHVRESVLSSKICGRLIYGQDILLEWQLPDIDIYTTNTIEMVKEFIKRARNYQCNLLDLQYPNEKDYFKGYIVFRNGEMSTKLLVSIYTWLATAILGKKYKKICGCKKNCIELSNAYLPGDLAEVLEEVFVSCREKWQYKVPSMIFDKMKLKKYCEKLLYYEKKFIDEFAEDDVL